MNTFTGKVMMIAAILLIGFLGLLFIREFFVFFMPFIIAYLIAKLMRPMKKVLTGPLRIPETLATLVVMVLILSILTLGISSLAYLLIQQLSTFVADLPTISQDLYASVSALTEAAESYINISPVYAQDFFNSLIDFIVESLRNLSMGFAQGLLDIVTFIPHLFFYAIILLIAIYYISKDFDTIHRHTFGRLKHLTLVTKLQQTFTNDVIFALIAYIKAQGILMVITFIILTLGLTAMGYRYALLISLGTAFLDALPVFGTGTVFGPWIIIEIINQDYTTAVFLGILYGVATITRQTLQPKILSTQIGISPLLTLISIYAGLKLLGVTGIILGPLLMILMLSLYRLAINTNVFKK
ncbi:MAG: hypothetical protein AVO33_07195 [delta proteobacterium ML8_F1]|nr:MAG: hypothetical protein AVO33_07195 [delta proteobacterium ML8_F1]